jgi:hypothetical protein
MSNDKPYYEGFFAVQIDVAGVFVTPLTQEQYRAIENVVAEVNIPLNLTDADYCMIAMLIDLPNDHLAFGEMLLLKAVVSDVVHDHRDHFQKVG